MATLTSPEKSTAMTKREQIVTSLRDPEYRQEFRDDIGTTLALQIRLLRERQELTQEQLAAILGRRQETISLWENPDYGRYTLSTLKDLARAFDVALIVRFAPYGELIDWTANLSPDRLAPVSFDEEFGTNQAISISGIGTASASGIDTVTARAFTPAGRLAAMGTASLEVEPIYTATGGGYRAAA